MTEEPAIRYLSWVLSLIASRAAQGAAYEQWTDQFARKEVREAWADHYSVSDVNLSRRRVTVAELLDIPEDQLRTIGFGRWDESLILIPLWAFNYIADGEELVSISGERATKGRDEIDLDVRAGCIAYGFPAARKEQAA